MRAHALSVSYIVRHNAVLLPACKLLINMAAECTCDDDALIGVFVYIDDVFLTLDRSEVRVQQGEVRRRGRQ